jgi:hypothetical protein
MKHGRLAALALGAGLAGALPAAGQSPLAAYPGFGHNAAADEARFEQEERTREQRVAQCMRAAGFQYTPAPSESVANLRSAAEAMAASRDPNERHVATLTPEQRREYFMALYGVPDPYSDNAAELHDPASPTGGGCKGEAFRAVPGVYAAAAAVTEEYVALRRAVVEDPRVKAAEERWAQCMGERGHDFTSPSQMHQDLAVAARTDREQARARIREVDPVARECGRSAGLDSTVAAVRIERETAFVAQHRATLDREVARTRSQPPE